MNHRDTENTEKRHKGNETPYPSVFLCALCALWFKYLSLSIIPDTRIENAVDEINDQVDEHEREGRE